MYPYPLQYEDHIIIWLSSLVEDEIQQEKPCSLLMPLVTMAILKVEEFLAFAAISYRLSVEVGILCLYFRL